MIALARQEDDLDLVLACYRQGEWGDGLLFAHLFAGTCVYDHTEKAWYLWQAHFWARDEVGQMRALVSHGLASVYLRAAADLTAQASVQPVREPAEAEEETAASSSLEKLIKGLSGRAFALRQLGRNSNVLAFACADPRLAVTSECWDTHPWLLGTREGVLDLRTGLLRDGRPADSIRTVIPTRFLGLEVPAPRFERFLSELFADREPEARATLVDFVQRVLGYGITGLVTEHLFLLLSGEAGRNGKDTLMSVLQAVLGPLVGAVSNDVILSSGRSGTPGAAKPHLCALQGKRMAWASESERGARFDIGQVKFLTGGGAIPARQLYGKEYVFEPSHLLLLLTNHKPHADAEDQAFWERLCPLTFRVRFVEQPGGPLERPRQRDLGTVLQAEASGILAWLVRGCLAWQREGLQIPQSVLYERARYQQEEDLLAQFVTDCCVLAPEAEVRASRLFERYLHWAATHEVAQPLSSTTFGREMKRQYRSRRSRQGSLYVGIGLSSPRQASEDEEVTGV
jgi:putative DNA primase/helicase